MGHNVLAVISGPDAARLLPCGDAVRLTVGRGGDLRIDDPEIEVVHGAVAGAEGALIPLGGRVTAMRGGDQRVGSSVLRLMTAPSEPEGKSGPVVERPVRDWQFPDDAMIPSMTETAATQSSTPRASGSGSLVGAVIGLGGASVVALVTNNAMFLLIGSIGALTAIGTWLVDLIRARRQRRRERIASAERDAAERERVLDHHRRRTQVLRRIWPIDLVTTAHSGRLWERRRVHGDAFRVVLAIEADHHPAVAGDSGDSADIPFIVDLEAIGVLAVIGPPVITSSVLRSIACQLAVATGPADLHLDQRGSLGLPVDLPHSDASGAAGRHRVILGSNPDDLIDSTSPLRRAVDTEEGVTAIVAIPPGQAIPARVESVLVVEADWRARWIADARCVDEQRVLSAAVGVSTRTASAIAARLRGVIDPELDSFGTRLPARVELGPLLDDSPPDALADGRLEMVLGVGEDGAPLVVDLVSEGPHVLVAGTTGSGKSELLRAMVVSAAHRASPDRLNIALIDFKGGAAFDSLAALPHVVGTLTDLDEHATARVLTGLTAELRHREALLREAGGSLQQIPRLLIVIDEFAELAAADPNASRAMLGIARRGRSLGVHLVIATQRPSGVVNDEVRANTDLRVCLRVNSIADSMDVIGDPAASTIDRSLPGRAVLVVAGREARHLQTALVTEAEIETLSSLAPALRRPWQAPLPTDLPALTGEASGDLGVVDRPTTQSLETLRWEPSRSSLIISGDPGTGRTTALRTVMAGTPFPTHLIAIRPSETDASPATHIGEPIRVDDTERVRRLLRRLDQEMRERREGSVGDQTVLAVDGIDAVITGLERSGDEESVARLRTLITDGVSLGIATVATTRSLHRLADLSCTHWLLYRAESGPAQHLGAPAELLPARVPGRILRFPDPALAQIRRPPTHPQDHGVAPPAPVGVLPNRTKRIAPVGARVAGGVRLEIGIDADDLAPVDITLTAGRHMLIIGGRGTGRSTTLDWIGESWRSVTGFVPARVRNSLDEVADGYSGVVLVDDALTIDAGASVDRLRNAPGVVLVAAVDGDGLRSAWGHWARDLRRWRTGVVFASGGTLAGDLLGATLPSRTPVPSRPGLAWWVADGHSRLLQIHAGGAGDTTTVHPSPVTASDMLAL